ncbi:MAG: hypothetical protein ILA06_06030 [Bacteroidaceae bacterium]|nr:hypothetical protein [Bacteroidaceae bacterium]
MQQLLLKLLQLISDRFPILSLVAEDCGQLETQEDTYPVTFPCLLIGNTDINWQDLTEGGTDQRGTATITVRLAIDCYDDVHIGSTQEQSIYERLQLAHDIHEVIQGVEFEECPDVWPLSRIKSRDVTLPGHIKVYESIYRFIIQD